MMTQHKIMMAFDFGTKRIGVAIGQTVTKSAKGICTLAAKDGKPQDHDIKQLIKKWQPDGLIVGIPLNMDGTDQPMSAKARQFAAYLRQTFELPVYEADERLTTKSAREKLFESGGFKALQDGQVDAIAAQLILETWLQENVN
jgi:putative Holliday junction resolvase